MSGNYIYFENQLYVIAQDDHDLEAQQASGEGRDVEVCVIDIEDDDIRAQQPLVEKKGQCTKASIFYGLKLKYLFSVLGAIAAIVFMYVHFCRGHSGEIIGADQGPSGHKLRFTPEWGWDSDDDEALTKVLLAEQIREHEQQQLEKEREAAHNVIRARQNGKEQEREEQDEIEREEAIRR